MYINSSPAKTAFDTNAIHKNTGNKSRIDCVPGYMGAEVDWVEGYMGAEVGWVEGYMGPEVDWVEGYMGAEVDWVEGYMGAEVDWVEGYMGTEVDWVEGYMGAEVDWVEGYMGAEVDWVEGYMGAEVDWVEGYMGAEVERTQYTHEVKQAILHHQPSGTWSRVATWKGLPSTYCLAMHQNAGDVGLHQNLIRRFCSIETTVIHICMYILNVLRSVQIDYNSIVKQCTSMNSNTPSVEIYSETA